jgi:hypothetical protein
MSRISLAAQPRLRARAGDAGRSADPSPAVGSRCRIVILSCAVRSNRPLLCMPAAVLSSALANRLGFFLTVVIIHLVYQAIYRSLSISSHPFTFSFSGAINSPASLLRACGPCCGSANGVMVGRFRIRSMPA